MSTLLAIDPGIRGCGAALFEGSTLRTAAYVPNPEKRGNGAHEAASMAWAVFGHFRANSLVVEWPQVYASRIREGKTKEDPNDLLALCGVDAALAALYHGRITTSIHPAEWKAQIPKNIPGREKNAIIKERVRDRLDAGELYLADAGAKDAGALGHNVWDAIGIGLHHLGRFARKRVIAP